MKPKRHILGLIIFLIAMTLLALSSLNAGEPTATGPATDQKADASAMTAQWGIQVTAIHIAAAGNMVDLRYKVLDAEKAEALFSKKTKPYLVHQKTGKVLAVPRTAKVGPLMSSYHPKQGRTYWMYFGNQTKLIQPGDAVTVVIGDFKIENLIVG
ncbi:MAG: hypothetical protein RBS34_06575 [Desulfofustis sp.]|jgi:hypothetical protein|nr:hypothetical protein [Desulfofustis sp.]